MPTGYTHIFSDRSPTFREYALLCARAFGACIMQRDEAMSEPPKHREEAAFYQENVDRDARELDRFLSLSEEDQWAEMRAVADRDRKGRSELRQRRHALRARYEAALAEVLAWVPPTAEHEKFRDFMADQLKTSVDFDCSDSEYCDPDRVTVVSPATHLEHLKARLDYSIKYRDEERERCNQANAWIDALYAALPEAK